MSWMDSASGSSTFHGGGGLSGNNGNIGAGTGYGNNGGMGNGNDRGSRTGGLGGGLSTGNTWYGNTAFGPSGGRVTGFVSLRDGGGLFDPRGRVPPNVTNTTKQKPNQKPVVVAPTGGLLDEEVAVTPPPPPPPAPPPAVFNPYAGFKNYPFAEPTMAGGWMGAHNWNNFAGNWPGNNNTNVYKDPAAPGGGSTHYKNNLR